MADAPHVVIIGAGSIGSWIGGELALHGRAAVSFLQRDSRTGSALRSAVESVGLTLEISGGKGAPRTLPAAACRAAFARAEDFAERLRGATYVLVVTKRHANPAVAPLLRAHVAEHVPIVLVQNGLGAVEEMRALLGGGAAARRPIHQAVVTISATLSHAEGRVVRSGPLVELVLDGLQPLAALLGACALPTRVISGAQQACELRGKLLLNMLNAPNAISGKPLGLMLLDRRACALAADTMFELRAAYAALGWRVEPWRMRALPFVMRALASPLLNALLRLCCYFVHLAAGAHSLANPDAKSSTVEDLDAGRPTEIDYLNGAAVRLGERAGVPTPANEAALRALEAEAVGRLGGRSNEKRSHRRQ